MFRKYLRANQRAVVFRLGKLVKVVGPGLVVTIPVLDQVHVVELDEVLPGWQGLGKQEVEQQVVTHVLKSLEEDLCEARPGERTSVQNISLVRPHSQEWLIMKNPMFLLLVLPSVAALVLAYFKILHRQWFPAGLLFVIGVTVILMSVWLLRWLNRLEIPVEAAQSGAAMAVPGGPVVMQLSGETIGSTLLWAAGFLIGAIGLVQFPDMLWKWWLSYLAAILLMLLMAVMILIAMNQKFERIVADSNGIEVRTEIRGLSVPGKKVAWRDVGAVKRVDVYVRRTKGGDNFVRREFVLLSREGIELLNLEDPLGPPQAYQRFLDSIPVWTDLAVQKDRVTR